MSVVLPPGLAEAIAEAEAEEARRVAFGAAMVEDILRFIRPTLAGTRTLLCPGRVRFDGRVIVGRDRVIAASYVVGVRAALRASPAAAAAPVRSPAPTRPKPGNGRRRRRRR